MSEAEETVAYPSRVGDGDLRVERKRAYRHLACQGWLICTYRLAEGHL